jgi:DNA-binding HxlR family transcriptional regulator
MPAAADYGQFCPLAMTAGILCNRWTVLVLREIFRGATTFNQISRGVPRMSRTLLSERLKDLVEVGILIHRETEPDHFHYDLTPGGEALRPVLRSMSEWGQEWLKVEPSLQNLDVRVLLWDIHRNAKPLALLPDPFVVQVRLTDQPEAKCDTWLIYGRDAVDISYAAPSTMADVEIEVSAAKLTRVWMGWEEFSQAVDDGSLLLRGPKRYLEVAEIWLGKSRVAHIKKQRAELLLG